LVDQKRNPLKKKPVKLGYVTPEEFDQWVIPAQMVGTLS
jgi:fumarate hydratase class II